MPPSAHVVFGGPEPLLLLLAALAVDAYVGGMIPFLPPGPAALIRQLAGLLDRKLNRQERSEATRLGRGALVVIVIGVFALILGAIIHTLSLALPHGWSLELVTLIACVQVREPWRRMRMIRRALDHRGTEAARAAVTGLTRHDPEALDEHGIVRVTIEAAARHLNQDVIAPAFWYILGGLPGFLFWTAVNALDSVIGHRSPRYEQFGKTAARLDDALNFFPARMTGALIVVASVFLGGTAPLAALRTMVKDARYHGSINAGWPMAAMAGALGLALGGPHTEGEVTVREVWIGQGRARATPADIGRALGLYAVTLLVLAGLIGTLMLILAAL
ncbi:MAG: CobD/CbiB family cobalamin biosynthesis protein [Rhodospirillaceae bacterium]